MNHLQDCAIINGLYEDSGACAILGVPFGLWLIPLMAVVFWKWITR